ncbi:MAG: glycosyltransferase [Bacteroidota bacterium]
MKIFVILSRLPYPLEKGDKLRAYHQIKHLSAQAEVHLCCLSDQAYSSEQLEELEKICTKLYVFRLSKFRIYWRLFWGFLSDKPFQILYFHDKAIHKKVRHLLQEIEPDQIYAQLVRTAEYVKSEFSYPKVLDYMDALSKGIQRRIKDAPFFSRIFLKMEYNRLVKYENLIFDYFDKHTIISEADRNFIYHPQKENIKLLLNGVDFSFFQTQEDTNKEPQYDLLFTGNMAYPPNINCAQYLAKEIIPLLKKEKSSIRLLIAGANPSNDVLKLQSENIHVSGWMEDIREAYLNAKIFLAPMQIGTGLQNKLLEAMAMKLPCITSPLANAGLNAKEGKDILIGENPEQIAKNCILLLENPTKKEEIAKNGYTFVRMNYDWQNATDILVKILRENKI